jgi:hypothetical protein
LELLSKTSSTRGDPSSIASNSESKGFNIPSISKSKGENDDVDDNDVDDDDIILLTLSFLILGEGDWELDKLTTGVDRENGCLLLALELPLESLPS